MSHSCKFRHPPCPMSLSDPTLCSKCELISVVDYNFQRLMSCAPKFAPMDPGEYRLSVQVWIRCPNLYNLYLLQKRAPTTGYFPSMWAPLTGGVKAGEDTITTIKREAKEELNITLTNLKFLCHNRHEQYIEEVWYAETLSTTFNLQKEEVATILFLEPAELLNYKAQGLLSPNSILPTQLFVEPDAK